MGNFDASSRMLYHKNRPKLSRLKVNVVVIDSQSGNVVFYNSKFTSSENNLTPKYYGYADELKAVWSPFLNYLESK